MRRNSNSTSKVSLSQPFYYLNQSECDDKIKGNGNLKSEPQTI